MKKILLPIEETERSLKALSYVKRHYASEEAELVLMMVDESLGYTAKPDVEAQALGELDEKLKVIAEVMDVYRITNVSSVGKAGMRITRLAREVGADLIVMTKSSKDDMIGVIGSTTEYVINNAPCDVIIVSESAVSRNEYRGLVYRTAKGLVNLRGQIKDKHSECLLPSINQDCIYHIDVTVGNVRFVHTAYNPDTRSWDQPPLPGQDAILDIGAGESRDILVKADSTDGKADRIRVVNRDMKREAVFSFSITAAETEEAEEEKVNETSEESEAPAVPETEETFVAEVQEAAEDSALETDEQLFEGEPEVPDFSFDPEAEAEPETDIEAPAAEDLEIETEEPVIEEEPEEPKKEFKEALFTVVIND